MTLTGHMLHRLFVSVLSVSLALSAADWRPIFNGKNLDGWEVSGQSVWTVLSDGILVGQRTFNDHGNPTGHFPMTGDDYHLWLNQQSWLYTKQEFENFDLHVEYWVPIGGNSGVSIRDSSRGRQSYGTGHQTTPAHIGYEIQILGMDEGKYSTGSIYLFAPAKTGVIHQNDWNTLEIESRADAIRVKVNGQLVAEHREIPRVLSGVPSDCSCTTASASPCSGIFASANCLRTPGPFFPEATEPEGRSPHVTQ
jgi:hypothetical protein